jgi:hypothetical protein
MNKHILLAAILVGCATASVGVKSYGDMDTYTFGNWFSFTWEYDMDLMYGTAYEGGNYTGSDAPVGYEDAFNYEKYYAFAWSWIEGGATFEFFSAYEITPRFYIEPFEVHPWEQWVIWFRPISEDYDFTLFDVNVYSSSYWECCKAYLTWEEHAKVAKRSFVDYAIANGAYDLAPTDTSYWAYKSS